MSSKDNAYIPDELFFQLQEAMINGICGISPVVFSEKCGARTATSVEQLDADAVSKMRKWARNL